MSVDGSTGAMEPCIDAVAEAATWRTIVEEPCSDTTTEHVPAEEPCIDMT